MTHFKNEKIEVNSKYVFVSMASKFMLVCGEFTRYYTYVLSYFKLWWSQFFILFKQQKGNLLIFFFEEERKFID